MPGHTTNLIMLEVAIMPELDATETIEEELVGIAGGGGLAGWGCVR